MEKFIFTIDNESQYFVSENRVIYWKNDFQKFFDVEKMFSQQGEGVSNFTPPPIVLLRKRQKVSKMYIWVFRQKLENRSLHAENDFFKIFEKNVHMGILTKISQNLPGV